MVTALANSILEYLLLLPRSTHICLLIITGLIFVNVLISMSNHELLNANIELLKTLKLSVGYILTFDNSSRWENLYQVVNATLKTYTIAQ